MNQIHDGGPAFPEVPGECNVYQGKPGMTLRDYFAGQALIATFLNGFAGPNEDDRAALCYRMADAMLRAREVSQ
ncbi:hypothetical protein [Burkholderia multivorans]|uniref:hypothetical protein n=1 Tax=Burkholderia multivorans TaxID=87883 RepID=UPI000D0119CC|nr:hypothetical protein [Burkholderia multivorans]PRH11000.1 hypothetical protein C6T61_07480 [Burkholderia multivorans]